MGAVVSVENLVKRYKDAEANAIDKVGFQVESGEFFSLLGADGAGKSTLIHILCSLITQTEGTVTIKRRDIGEENPDIASDIGVVFQNPVLDKLLTVYENLMVRGSFYNLDKKELQEHIAVLAHRLSLEAFLKRPYGRLSIAQQRTCEIARALVSRPQLLLLDEPATGLDLSDRHGLEEVIEHIHQSADMTIILAASSIEEVERADRVALLDRGRILCIDTPQNLKERHAEDFRALFSDGNEEKEAQS